MKQFVCILSVCAFGFLSGCATAHKVPVPSVFPVKSKIQQASNASARSSEEIKKFKSKAEQIDYKATKALEILN